MALEIVEADVFEKIKGKVLGSIKELLVETYARDREDFKTDLAEALGLDDESELPKLDVEVVLRLGKQVISTSGFEVEEKDTEDDEDE